LIKYLLHDHSNAYKAVEVQICARPPVPSFARLERLLVTGTLRKNVALVQKSSKTSVDPSVETHFEWAGTLRKVSFYSRILYAKFFDY
jgi:hypothetical protein